MVVCGKKHLGDDTFENDGILVESTGNLKILVDSDENLSDGRYGKGILCSR